MRLPLTVVAEAGIELGEKAVLQIEARISPAIVVMQDCVIDKPQARQIALAPVLATRPRDEDELAALQAELPPRDGSEGAYVYDLFRVDPFGDVVPIREGLERVADLKQISPFAPREELAALRVACMQPAPKRLLRIKLGAFFSRASDEDAQRLGELGLPPGLPE